MKHLLDAIRHNPLLWLLVFVPALFAGKALKPEAQTMLFVLSVLAIVRWRRCSVTQPNPWRPRRAIRSVVCSTPRWET